MGYVSYTHTRVSLTLLIICKKQPIYKQYSLLQGCVDGRLGNVEVKFDTEMSCVAVCLVSGGYPGSYPKGKVITGW